MTRQDLKDQVWLAVAHDIARLSTCARRDAGCVLLSKEGWVLSTGYNGLAPDMAHCKDHPCPGAHMPSGTGLDSCEALHAEWNALIQCKFPERIDTVYVTASPCVTCVKLLSATTARRIVFAEAYPHLSSETIWKKRGGRLWEHVPCWDQFHGGMRPGLIPEPT